MTEPALKTLDQLATENSQLTARVTLPDGRVVPTDPEGHLYLWEHRVADMIHGWSSHEYHYQADPVLLTDEQYKAALQAARDGHMPHEPAKPVPPTREMLDKRVADAAAQLKKKKDELEAERKAVAEGKLAPQKSPNDSKGAER